VRLTPVQLGQAPADVVVLVGLRPLEPGGSPSPPVHLAPLYSAHGRQGARRAVQRNQEAAGALHAQAAQIFEMTRELESLTKYTPAWYAGMRAKVGARRRVRLNEDFKRT
jgi:hypothetical protein